MSTDLRSTILLEHDLAKAIDLIKQSLPANPTDGSILSRISSVEENYKLMCVYAFRGYKDPQAENIYTGLLRKAYEISSDLQTAQDRQKRISLMRAAASARHLSGKQDRARETLEKFVQDMALASLSPDGEGEKLRLHLHADHQHYLGRLFDAIVVSGQWTDTDRRLAEELLLSPLVESTDVAQLVSATMLSAINAFDVNKWLALTNVYEQSTDEQVRQRCLVGWVLALPQAEATIYPDVAQRIRQLASSEATRKELLELQMQLFYCTRTEADTQSIQRDIMPTLIEGNQLAMTRAGIVEKEDDSLSDILHPEAADQRMEAMEQSFKRMMDMQRAGSDIYFGGFSQMKRFAFFETLCNWFCPFYPEHPQLQQKIEPLRQGHFVDTVLRKGPFCESDKYSFALALASIVDRLPEGLMQMLGSEGAVLGGSATEEEQQSPAYIRRMYLQDVYRFYRLFQYKSDFRNPFEGNPGSLRPMFFFVNKLFSDTELASSDEALLKFLYKQKADADLLQLAARGSALSATGLVLVGNALLHQRAWTEASERFAQARQLEPESEQALRGLARAAFSQGHYAEAAACYEELAQRHASDPHYALNLAIAQLCTDQRPEAMAALFRLAWEQPDNLSVRRALAWGHLLSGQPEKAEPIYKALADEGHSQPTDHVNTGYALWFQSRVAEAVDAFRSYLSQRPKGEGGAEALVREFRADSQLLRQYGIGPVEQRIMCDLIHGAVLG